jgi:hypothetical protein
MLLVTLKNHQGWPHARLFVVVSQLTGNTPGANFSVAETFMNNVPNVPRERSNLISNLAILTFLSACTAASIPWTRSADVDGRPLLCPSITFTRPLSNSLHRLRTCRTVIALAPYTVTSSRWISTGGTFFAYKKEWQRTSSFIHSFSTIAILKLLLCLFTSPEMVTITAI